MRLKTTLEQWQTLQAIEQAGSIQSAAVTLNKSHTTLIYSVKKLEDQLGIKLIEVKGRKAGLTEHGKTMLRRAQSMLEQARELEMISEQLNSGVESQITVAIDHLCDPSWLYTPLSEFLTQNNTTSVQVVETSLSKTTDMVINELADIAIINLPITNYPAEAFGTTTMVPVIAAQHPLAKKEHISLADFATTSQIVVRDLGESDKEKRDVGWLRARQRITVDNFDHAFRAVEQGVGFCRLPKHLVEYRQNDRLKVIDLEHSNQYQVALHLTLPKGAKSGPAALGLYQTLLDSAKVRVE
ncbi:LysR family transcriptional regulator [Vibrio rotiferianus]|uniref:LysR family transcriptional regulator n=1 Tax=Vibrio rotiferianus TaxID=190895 RepID=UPI0011101A27|nr:LysR family transcriptional regulator [Vibrio rotiferianus]TMX33447.1 LysR family transcriptional regulator [Vibrio rotiferianus]TMX48281.1 LysR family transcriptional regulator [Vibrio rotiferianus]TMX64115.1 LysR family transcriptional regulator [Vibrio rotiferianus]